MKDDADRQPEPWLRERNWQQAAIATAVMLGVGALFAAAWVVLAPESAEQLRRVQIAAPFGAFGVAVVTFCTVLWRGTVSVRQADMQLQQIEGLQKQIAQTDITNQANLLEKAAKLSASANAHEMAAGITFLSHIASAEASPFSQEATELLRRIVHAQEIMPNESDNLRLAMRYLARIGSEQDLWLSVGVTIFDDEQAVLYEGLAGITYRNCVFEEYDISRVRGFIFENCSFFECRIGAINRFRGQTKFNSCKVDRVVSNRGIYQYIDCDFSRCGSVVNVEESTFKDCYYYQDTPPNKKTLAKIGHLLEARHPSDRREDTWGTSESP